MMKRQLGLLTLGVFLIIVAIWVGAFILSLITFNDVLPLVLLSSGIWTVVIAAVKAVRPKKNGGAFGIFGWGTLFIVVGGSWYFSSLGMPIEFTVVFVLLLLGALAIAAALKSR
ncbi:MAG: hypothetical protein NWF11_03620 [Candidatus Bathyarchaeota archaeon]|nr:hypothetical protein [Candidatus Bathyarchaeota archaeon]